MKIHPFPLPAPANSNQQDREQHFRDVLRDMAALGRRLGIEVTEPVRVPKRARSATREQVLRIVCGMIRREAGTDDAAEMYEELLELMEDAELDEDIDERPIEEIVAEMRSDLGLDGEADD